MTSDSMQRLRSLAQHDDELLAALQAATSHDEVIRLAAQHGIELNPSELDAVTNVVDAELADTDLESAAGGGHPKYGTFTDITC